MANNTLSSEGQEQTSRKCVCVCVYNTVVLSQLGAVACANRGDDASRAAT